MTLLRLAFLLVLLGPLWAAGSRAVPSVRPEVLDGPLLEAGGIWRYLDDGSDQGTAWREPAFDDSAWASGPAQLGYGEGDEATVVSYGPDPNSKFVTTYFRRSFTLADPAEVEALELRLLVDDGAIVYLNGHELQRENLAVDPVLYDTLATGGPAVENAFNVYHLPAQHLVAGANVVAVEVHQVSRTTSDLSFDLALFARPAVPRLARGPYLQLGTPTGVTVRWRTTLPASSRLRYGLSPGVFTGLVELAGTRTEHALALTGLLPNTLYYYSVETIDGVVLENGPACRFHTAPPVGTIQPVRIWALGDSGRAGPAQNAVRDAFLALQGGARLDLWLMMGDNAYDSGTDAEYQLGLFDPYREILKQSVLWPTLGNHDTGQSGDFFSPYPYFDIFTLPAAAEAGGVASGTPHYYSFDYANVHFICLDSMTADRSPNGAQANWLRADLAQTTADWIVAFWHHPPYSKGSHDSDFEGQLIEMRAVFNPILEAGGVDLILTGHSHAYERSYLLDGHYGPSSTFVESMKLDAGSGRPDDTGAYAKPPGRVGRRGAVYAVIGQGCQISGGALNHPAMHRSLNVLGSLVLDVYGPRLDARLVRDDGVVDDAFTLQKDAALYDSDGDGLPDSYERRHGFDRHDPADALADSDGDGFTNLQEFLAGTDPRDARDSLRVTSFSREAKGTTLEFRTIHGRRYRVEWTADLNSGLWQALGPDLIGTGQPLSVFDAAVGVQERFYRVVHLPP
ncbi:MAG: metallophosphoesterase family protein [Verrucomicrobia bacterium]|nr:metallophosphoesterase family protein [Verrucomicrobiota bacterium]